ncbi:MAG: ribbon-helix-helix domain-containing protein [Alphaproteobacteria bacterium]|nr:ribbon-helix-helix domain-containing protein [Alphaproteobacteria bacterium]
MSRPLKRSFQIRGHRTSLSLEQPFWQAFRDIAAKEGKTLAGLVAEIDQERDAMSSGLSSAVRVFILDYYRSRHNTIETTNEAQSQTDKTEAT